MDKILITGVFGFIGRSMYRKLHDRAIVRGIGNMRSNAEVLLPASVAFTGKVNQENLTRLDFIPDLIIHCAGSGTVGPSYLEPAQDFYHNIDPLIETLEFIRKNAPRAKLVMISSGAVYGNHGNAALSENMNCVPESPYGLNKFLGEQLCRSYGKCFGVSSLILRLFSVYGPGLTKQLLWETSRKWQKGNLEFFGTGQEVRDWIHVEDVVELLLFATPYASSSAPVFNGATGIGTSVKDVVGLLVNSLGEKGSLQFTGKKKAGDPEQMVGDISKSLSLGWRPRHQVAQGIVQYAGWYLKNQSHYD